MIWIITFLVLDQLCVSAAAYCNAVMDCVENEHIYITKFVDKKNFSTYWYKRDTWKISNGSRDSDAWHDYKSAMFVFDWLSKVFLALMVILIVIKYGLHAWYVFLIIPYGVIHFTNKIQTFNLFYNKVFKK
jgi:hypothetical protein